MYNLVNVPLEELDVGDNVRRTLGDITDFAASVAALGVLSPVTVYRSAAGRWVLLAGHRRVQAARQAGQAVVPALDMGDKPPAEDRLIVALVENLMREDLNPLDEAAVYQTLAGKGWTVRQIADETYRSKSHVARRLALLTLPEETQELIHSGQMGLRHAGNLVRLVTGGVPEDRISELAGADPAPAAAAVARLRARHEQERRRVSLADTGVTVVGPGGLSFKHTLAFMGIDPDDHQGEPCHVVAVELTPQPHSEIVEVAGCSNPLRHEPTAEELADTERETRRDEQATRARWDAREQATARSDVHLGEQIAAQDSETIVWEALAIGAQLNLGPPPPGDVLLPTPDEIKKGRDWGCPPEAIANAPAVNLAAALLRHYIHWATRRQWREQSPPAAIELIDQVQQRVGYQPPDGC